MAFFVNLFSPETHAAFAASNRSVSGFRESRKGSAQKVKKGDVFVCYVTTASRWCGLLEVVDGPFEDHTPLFLASDDPFSVRFHVRQLVWLDIERSIPVHDSALWSNLSFTRRLALDSLKWTGTIRASLTRLTDDDGIKLTRGRAGASYLPARL
ncbi:EVE domain-containing protein [Caballeronia cordobensis]|uniref:hypothetical protein n=1 Tax=Caballeronia cordobensis TaxID=1353886 RepID=UPI0011777DEB|nr:hypothetical protein [Caballeronia cordobensis]